MIDRTDKEGVSPVAERLSIPPVDHVFTRYDLTGCGGGLRGSRSYRFTSFSMCLSFRICLYISLRNLLIPFNLLALQSAHTFMRATTGKLQGRSILCSIIYHISRARVGNT